MKVLLIEDDRKPSAYLARGLREQGHVVDLAATGRDGLFLATDGGHDVLIVDRMLPGLDGIALVQALRGTGVKAPVLFLTALGGVGDRVRGLDAGGDDYLVKPFAFAELLARVNALARRPPLSDSLAAAKRRRRPVRLADPSCHLSGQVGKGADGHRTESKFPPPTVLQAGDLEMDLLG